MKRLQTIIGVCVILAVCVSCGDQGGPGPVSGKDIFRYIRADDAGNAAVAYRGLSNPAIRNGEGRTPLLEAIHLGKTKIAGILIGLGAPVNPIDPSDTAPLLLAVERRNAEMVKLLLDAKADVNAVSGTGATAVRAAVAGRLIDTEIINLLVAAGADKSQVTDMPCAKETVVRELKTVIKEEISAKTWAKLKEVIKIQVDRGEDGGRQVRELGETVSRLTEESRESFRSIGEDIKTLQNLLKEYAGNQGANQQDVKDLSEIIKDMEDANKNQ